MTQQTTAVDFDWLRPGRPVVVWFLILLTCYLSVFNIGRFANMWDYWSFGATLSMLIYCGVFYYTSFTAEPDTRNVDKQVSGRKVRGVLWSAMAILAILHVFLLSSIGGIVRLPRELVELSCFLLIMSGFLMIDGIIGCYAEDNDLRKRHQSYFLFVDAPFLVSFLTIGLYYAIERTKGAVDPNVLSAFVGGAGAFQLLAQNTVFALMSKN